MFPKSKNFNLTKSKKINFSFLFFSEKYIPKDKGNRNVEDRSRFKEDEKIGVAN